MRKIWHESAWDEYVAWQREDAKTLKRINLLLQSIDRNGTSCIGNPEPLRGNLSGWWSVRINQADRIVFRISALTPSRMGNVRACQRRKMVTPVLRSVTEPGV